MFHTAVWSSISGFPGSGFVFLNSLIRESKVLLVERMGKEERTVLKMLIIKKKKIIIMVVRGAHSVEEERWAEKKHVSTH